jgi:hypothetical protein
LFYKRLGGPLKVPLLENISAVADEIFRGAGHQVESEEAALDQRKLIATLPRGLDSGGAVEDADHGGRVRGGAEAGGGGCKETPCEG